MTNKTCILKQEITKWYIVDGKNKKLGRLSTKIAATLNEKNSIYYTDNQFRQTYVIVINAKHIEISGNKKYQKIYRRHSGKPGGLKKENFEQLLKRVPTRIIEKSVLGMLPKNKLGRSLFRNLKVYPEQQHPHIAQKPIYIDLNN